MNRVLVVDDEAGMRAALEAHFLRRDWHVEWRECRRGAGKNFRRGCIRLVVTDIAWRERGFAGDAGGAAAGADRR